jgi:hypothetical protein
MLATRLIELIEIHAEGMTRDVLKDFSTNARTPSFRVVPRAELESRVYEIYHHLGNWIGDPKDDAVQAEFEEWGHRRFRQGIRLSEIVYAVLILKQHLRQYIRDNGLVESARPRAEADYVLPMHLHSLQELSGMVSEFFDKALYYLTRGYEAEAQAAPRTPTA